MPTKNILLFLISIVGFTGGLNAQYMPMPSSTTIGTPYGPVTINTTTYMYMPMYVYPSLQNYKYDFSAVLQNDSVIKTKTKMEYDDSASSYYITFKHGKLKQRLYPRHTKQLIYTTASDDLMKGLPTDSVWYFKTETGKINMYSYLPDATSDYAVAIQNGDSAPIINLTKESVLPLINSSEKALKQAQKGNLIRALYTYNDGK